MAEKDWLVTRSLIPWHTRRSAERSSRERRGSSVSRHLSRFQNPSNAGLEQSTRPHVDRALANAAQTLRQRYDCCGVCVFLLHWLQEISSSPNSSLEPEVFDDEVEKAVEGLLVNVVPERLFLSDSILCGDQYSL